MTSVLISFSTKCFDVNIVGRRRTEHLLTEKNRYFSIIILIKQHIQKFKRNCRRKRMQEKESSALVRCDWKILSPGITVWHHSASLLMPNSYPHDGIFNPHLTTITDSYILSYKLDRIKRIWYLSPMRAAKVQASLRIHAVSPEPLLLAHTTSESRGTFRQKIRSLAPLNGWACTLEICNDGMLEDTNSLDGAQLIK